MQFLFNIIMIMRTEAVAGKLRWPLMSNLNVRFIVVLSKAR